MAPSSIFKSGPVLGDRFSELPDALSAAGIAVILISGFATLLLRAPRPTGADGVEDASLIGTLMKHHAGADALANNAIGVLAAGQTDKAAPPETRAPVLFPGRAMTSSHRVHDCAPVLPSVELGQIVGAHQPRELYTGYRSQSASSVSAVYRVQAHTRHPSP